MLKLNEPAAVGVPLNVPPAVKVSPPGREPDSRDHVYGVIPPVAVKVCVYDVPTVPAGSGEVVVIESGFRGLMTNVEVFWTVF